MTHPTFIQLCFVRTHGEVLSKHYITLNHTQMTIYQLSYIFTTFRKTGFMFKALPVYIKLRLYTALSEPFLKWNDPTFARYVYSN